MKPKQLFVFFFLLIVAKLSSCDTKQTRENISEKNDTVEVSSLKESFHGRLFSSGLSREEAGKLRLPWPVYQLTGPESYFFSGGDSLEAYLGQCIEIRGAILPDWKGVETINGQFTYNRGAIDAVEAIVAPLDACSNSEVAEENRILSGNYKIYKGIAVRMKRPAPDIAYDYHFRLDEPIRDEFNQIEPGKLISGLPLEVYKPADLNIIQQAVESQSRLIIQASLLQGYAESLVLQVVEVREEE